MEIIPGHRTIDLELDLRVKGFAWAFQVKLEFDPEVFWVEETHHNVVVRLQTLVDLAHQRDWRGGLVVSFFQLLYGRDCSSLEQASLRYFSDIKYS
jgi:hypothetical protein